MTNPRIQTAREKFDNQVSVAFDFERKKSSNRSDTSFDLLSERWLLAVYVTPQGSSIVLRPGSGQRSFSEKYSNP